MLSIFIKYVFITYMCEDSWTVHLRINPGHRVVVANEILQNAFGFRTILRVSISNIKRCASYRLGISCLFIF